ncbi:hypothetical protein BJ742DRAFT_774094 [Cladochytrium replicatum]|nr:hypothetical protein BJ742DRAFT_774094 [Cladochytrium replicatum]
MLNINHLNHLHPHHHHHPSSSRKPIPRRSIPRHAVTDHDSSTAPENTDRSRSSSTDLIDSAPNSPAHFSPTPNLNLHINHSNIATSIPISASATIKLDVFASFKQDPVALFNQNLTELFHRSHSLPHYLSPSASHSLHKNNNSLPPARSLRARRNLKRKLADHDDNSTDPHDDPSDHDDLSDIPHSPIKPRPSPVKKLHHHSSVSNSKPRGRPPAAAPHHSNHYNRSSHFNPSIRIAQNPSLYTGSFPTVVVPSVYRYALRPEYKVTARPPPIRWDGLPLDIPTSTSGYTLLTPEEIHVCRTLRIQPGMYLTIKEHALATLSEEGWFRKNQMQRMFRMNVNKSARLYDWFKGLGWIPPPPTETSTPPPPAPLPTTASSSSRTNTLSSSKSPQRSLHSHDEAMSDAVVTAVEDEDDDDGEVEMDGIAGESKAGVELVSPAASIAMTTTIAMV